MTKSSTILHYIYFVDYTMPESGSANYNIAAAEVESMYKERKQIWMI